MIFLIRVFGSNLHCYKWEWDFTEGNRCYHCLDPVKKLGFKKTSPILRWKQKFLLSKTGGGIAIKLYLSTGMHKGKYTYCQATVCQCCLTPHRRRPTLSTQARTVNKSLTERQHRRMLQHWADATAWMSHCEASGPCPNGQPHQLRASSSPLNPWPADYCQGPYQESTSQISFSRVLLRKENSSAPLPIKYSAIPSSWRWHSHNLF